MKPSDFKYFKANSLDHALDILNSEENVKIISGGQSLVPLMNFRLGQPDILLDINDIKDLNFVSESSSNLEIGSLLTHTNACLLYTSPSPRDLSTSRMPSSA